MLFKTCLLMGPWRNRSTKMRPNTQYPRSIHVLRRPRRKYSLSLTRSRIPSSRKLFRIQWKGKMWRAFLPRDPEKRMDLWLRPSFVIGLVEQKLSPIFCISTLCEILQYDYNVIKLSISQVFPEKAPHMALVIMPLVALMTTVKRAWRERGVKVAMITKKKAMTEEEINGKSAHTFTAVYCVIIHIQFTQSPRTSCQFMLSLHFTSFRY